MGKRKRRLGEQTEGRATSCRGVLPRSCGSKTKLLAQACEASFGVGELEVVRVFEGAAVVERVDLAASGENRPTNISGRVSGPRLVVC